MASLIYLASPYSHPSKNVRYYRYLNARRAVIKFTQEGVAIFSPIVYGYDMETVIGTNFEPWQHLNDTMIEKCDEFWVLCDEEWKKSRGVKHEIELANKLGKPIRFFDINGNPL